jgi:hypothetical protein
MEILKRCAGGMFRRRHHKDFGKIFDPVEGRVIIWW